jgi:transcriptional regulator with XRE-family HTH domain
MTENETPFQTNLRRLIHFEHRSGREAAAALGVTERTISQWLTGKRYPSGEALMRIDKTYGISPRELDLDPVEFAQRLSDPDRMTYTAQMLDRIHGSTAARAKRLRSERVVPIEKAKKS